MSDSAYHYPIAIERLAEDEPLRRRLSKAAREFAHEDFDPAHNAARDNDAQTLFRPSIRVVGLHHCWTADWYRNCCLSRRFETATESR